MIRNAYLYIIIICVLYIPFSYTGRRDWVRKRRIQVAQLEPELLENTLEKKLGIPHNTTSKINNNATPLNTVVIEQDVPEKKIEIPSNEITSHQESTFQENNEDDIELYFENADLYNFIQQIEDVFDVTFIMDDAFEPLPQGAKSLKGNKISYRTNVPISRSQAWSTFNTFLHIAGFAVVPHTDERTYRITPIARAQKSSLKSFIGTKPDELPETDDLIRYVYFIENNTVENIKAVVEQFRSNNSSAVYLNEHKGFILTDISYNIKKLMEIIKELDTINMPESLSVLKLRRADAKQVKELYDSLTKGDTEPTFGPRTLNKKEPTSLALPENVTIIAEPRTNSLILLGPKHARERIETFIVKNVDVELDQEYSPLHTYQLHYADATTIADIMNNVTKFGANTEAGKSGGVRGGDKYMRPMSFIAEPTTNRLIVKGHYEDYLKAEEIIRLLDEDQPQVAIEVLILAVDISKQKELGTQIRSKLSNEANGGGWDGLLGKNVKFQTSGLFKGSNQSGIQQKTGDESTGVKRLLGNLVNLVSGATVGNTVITLGQDLCDVWGIMQMLETVANVQLVSNPFLIATNKTPAEVSLGEERRVQTATVAGGSALNQNLDAFGSDAAKLIVKVTPQINSDGMIILDLDITIDNFTDPSPTSATKQQRNIKTSTIIANNQVLALGGLVRNRIANNMSKTPLLGDIPILGWFFKNKKKTEDKQNLLILVSTRIIEPKDTKNLNRYNEQHIDDYQDTLQSLVINAERRDPIHKLFFESGQDSTEKEIEKFLFERHGSKKGNRRQRIKRKKEKQQELERKRKELERIALSTQVKQKPQEFYVNAQKNNLKQNNHVNKFKQNLQHKKRTNLALTDMLSTHTGRSTI